MVNYNNKAVKELKEIKKIDKPSNVGLIQKKHRFLCSKFFKIIIIIFFRKEEALFTHSTK